LTRRIERDGVTLWLAGQHPQTACYAKALGVFVGACARSPIDLIPDFIPLIGYVNDVRLLRPDMARHQALAATGPRRMSRSSSPVDVGKGHEAKQLGRRGIHRGVVAGHRRYGMRLAHS
jgi:hypothetical protein